VPFQCRRRHWARRSRPRFPNGWRRARRS